MVMGNKGPVLSPKMSGPPLFALTCVADEGRVNSRDEVSARQSIAASPPIEALQDKKPQGFWLCPVCQRQRLSLPPF